MDGISFVAILLSIVCKIKWGHSCETITLIQDFNGELKISILFSSMLPNLFWKGCIHAG